MWCKLWNVSCILPEDHIHVSPCLFSHMYIKRVGKFPISVFYSVQVIKADGCQLRVWQEKGGISPLFMKECWVSVNIVIVGFIAVITLFYLPLFLPLLRFSERLALWWVTLSFCVIISPYSENSGVVWRANWPLCHGHCASIWRVAHFGTYMYGKERDRLEGLCKTWRPKRKSKEMRSFLPDFQIKQRTTAERAMIHSVFFNHPQMYFMHMRTFLLTKASVCSDGWLTSKGVVKGSEIQSLAKWQASDQWSEENFPHSTVLQMTGCISKSPKPLFSLLGLTECSKFLRFLEVKSKTAAE